MNTATLTRHPHHRTAAELIAFLRTRYGRDAYRHDTARATGANPAQLAALALLEVGLDKHFPVYQAHPDGTVTASYTHPDTGEITAHVTPDGTTRIDHP